MSNSKDESSSIGCLGIVAILFVLGIIGSFFEDDSDESSGTESADTESTVCEKVQGVYVGDYNGVSPSGPEFGDVGLILQESCDYTVTMDGRELLGGTLEQKSSSRYLFQSGETLRFSMVPGQGRARSASWTEEGDNYRINYNLQRIQ